jgi:predicted enzyme related to lactoylglutathione lyase
MESERPNLKRVFGMIAHTELVSTDPASTRDFLKRVFDWRFESMETPQGEMISYQTPGGAQGSIRKTSPKELPLSMNYILVDDLSSAEKKILASGGEIVLSRVDVPDMGSFFWFKIPGGPVLACWEDSPNRRM